MTTKNELSEAARMLSKLGASKGGKASAANLSKDELSERGRFAVKVKWDNWRKAHPEGRKQQVYESATEKFILSVVEKKGTMRVAYDDRKRPSGRREYKAAAKLVEAGKVQCVMAEGTEGGATMTIERLKTGAKPQPKADAKPKTKPSKAKAKTKPKAKQKAKSKGKGK